MADLLADLLADSDSDDHLDDKAGAATAAAAAVGSMGGAAAAAPADGAGEMPAHPLGGGGALHAAPAPAPAPAPVPDAAASDTTWPAPPELPPEKPTKARRRWVPPEFDVEVGAGVEEEEADEPTDDEDISPSPATAAFVSPTPATRDATAKQQALAIAYEHVVQTVGMSKYNKLQADKEISQKAAMLVRGDDTHHGTRDDIMPRK